MNTLFASLLIAMSTSLFADPANNPKAAASFESSVYISATRDIRVAINKEQSHVVQIKLLNEQGRLVAVESVAKKANQYRARFDVNELPDGHYQLVITDGSAEEVRNIDLTTSVPTARFNRTVAIQ